MGIQITGPGDPSDQRMVLAFELDTASIMKVETGDAEQVFCLTVDARTLASVEERERRTYMFSEAQMAFLAGQAMGEINRRRRTTGVSARTAVPDLINGSAATTT